MRVDVIVSRHPAAVEFIRQELGLADDVPVLASDYLKEIKVRTGQVLDVIQ